MVSRENLCPRPGPHRAIDHVDAAQFAIQTTVPLATAPTNRPDGVVIPPKQVWLRITICPCCNRDLTIKLTWISRKSAYNADMSKIPTIRLKDFCQLFDVEDREVRYILEEGHVPTGVADHPNTGNHREFGPESAFWLAVVVKLRQAGVKTPFSAKVADFAVRGLRTVTQNLSWDPSFLPMHGWFDTDHEYCLDVGDLKYIRMATDANPSRDGLYTFDWSAIRGRRRVDPKFTPFVIFRVDLTQIARVLSQVEGWSSPRRR